jgi:C4-dicarboxylate-specific signal transduction histidine kinase
MSERKIQKLEKKVQILESLLEEKSRELFHQKELAQANFEFIQSITNIMNDMIIVCLENGDLIYANESASYQFGQIVQGESKSIHTIFSKRILKQLDIKGASEQEKYIKCQLTSINNQHFPALISAKKTQISLNKEVQNVHIYTIVDYTELKVQEDIIEHQKAKILHKNQLSNLGEMARGIAHEINNPLSIIDGQARRLSDLIKNPDSTEDQRVELSEKIQKNIKRITNIIVALKKLTKIPSSEHISNIDLESIIRTIKELSFERLKQKGISLILPSDNDERITIRANETIIIQTLVSLITNAEDAVTAQDQKWIRIEALSKPDHICIRVIDSGNGIDDHILSKIFNPFFTTKEFGKGTGLGLSSSRESIESIGGHLEYEKSSTNTSFSVRLPKAS